MVFVCSKCAIGTTQDFLCRLTGNRRRGEDYGFDVDDLLFDDLQEREERIDDGVDDTVGYPVYVILST